MCFCINFFFFYIIYFFITSITKYFIFGKIAIRKKTYVILCIIIIFIFKIYSVFFIISNYFSIFFYKTRTCGVSPQALPHSLTAAAQGILSEPRQACMTVFHVWPYRKWSSCILQGSPDNPARSLKYMEPYTDRWSIQNDGTGSGNPG